MEEEKKLSETSVDVELSDLKKIEPYIDNLCTAVENNCPKPGLIIICHGKEETQSVIHGGRANIVSSLITAFHNDPTLLNMVLEAASLVCNYKNEINNAIQENEEDC